MVELTLSLISLASAATLQPPQVIAMIILLQTRLGTINGLGYLAGMTTFRLALVAAAWIHFSSLESSIETSGGNFGILVGTILVVLGLLMLIYALRRGFSASDEDETATSWLDKLEAVSPAQAFLVGIAFLALDPRDWIIDISAINLIAEADLSSVKSILGYLAYILLAQSLLWIPLLFTLLSPERADSGLATLNSWMKKNARSIEITVAIIFGLVFLAIGVEHLGVF
jgi:threonine/homoserine/homoserine lactone efflux protein